MSEVRISVAEPGDAEAIWNLQRLAFVTEAELYGDYRIPPLTQTLEELKAEFRDYVFLKAVDQNSRIVGTARARMENGNECWIYRVAVHPDCRKRGIGEAVMRAAEAQFPGAAVFKLGTGTKSLGNQRFYRRLGYRDCGTAPLNERVTFVIMEKPNDPPIQAF